MAPLRRVFYQDEKGYTKMAEVETLNELFNLIEMYDSMHIPFQVVQGTTVLAVGNMPWRKIGEKK